MRNVTRPSAPKSLRENSQKWTKKLLKELDKYKKLGQRAPDTVFNNYKKEDVKSLLTKMYKGLCAYCEAEIGVVDYPHVEHRKPKRKYPTHTFVWENLHLSCSKCNTPKGNQYSISAPILDAAIDRPILNHLDYELRYIKPGLGVKAKSPRGRTTMDHTNLNREKLKKARLKVFIQALDVIKEINNCPEHQREEYLEQLNDLSEEQFGSIIGFVTRNFGGI